MIDIEQRVTDAENHFNIFVPADEPYEHVETGEMNAVLLHPDEPIAIKVPRVEALADRIVNFETFAQLALVEADTPPPLHVPDMLESHPEYPPYLAIARLGGTALSLAEVRNLEPADQANLGRSVGRFVAWMAEALPESYYRQIMQETDVSVFDREQWAWHYANPKSLDKAGYHDLADALRDNFIDFMKLRADDRLQPTLIGHDDLRPGNIMFEPNGDGWVATGVIDFGLVKPSNPGRELRHMHIVSDATSEAAIESYETASGQAVDKDVLQAWAVSQTATIAANYLSGLAKPPNDSHLVMLKQSMQRLLPESTWSELPERSRDIQ